MPGWSFGGALFRGQKGSRSARLTHEVGFERLQPIGSDGNVAMEEDGFVYESFQVNFSHGKSGVVEVSLPRSPWRACSRTRATRTLYTPFFAVRVPGAPVFRQRSSGDVRRSPLPCENF